MMACCKCFNSCESSKAEDEYKKRCAYQYYCNQAWFFWWQQRIAMINWMRFVENWPNRPKMNNWSSCGNMDMACIECNKCNDKQFDEEEGHNSNDLNPRKFGYLKRRTELAIHNEHRIKRNYDHYNSQSIGSLIDHPTLIHHEDDYNNQEEENEYDDFELNEEFKRFLEISEKHRQEREKERMKGQKSINKRKKENYRIEMEYCDVSDQPIIATTEAPKLQNKKEKYKELYGNNFDKICNLEAELQLDFIKFCDKIKPTFWPNIPLNL